MRYPFAVDRFATTLLFGLIRLSRAAAVGLVALAFVALAFVVPAAAQTGPSLAPPFHAPAVDRARDGGVISGRILDVDYQRGLMSLRSGRSTVDVYVLPTTNIQSKTSSYHTIADLKKGQDVQVFTSILGSRTNAQIIRLK